MLYKIIMMMKKFLYKKDNFFIRFDKLFLNNLVLVIICFTILIGTLGPFFIEKLIRKSVSIGAPFYINILSPLCVVLLMLMIYDALSNKKFLFNLSNVKKNYKIFLFLLSLFFFILMMLNVFNSWFIHNIPFCNLVSGVSFFAISLVDSLLYLDCFNNFYLIWGLIELQFLNVYFFSFYFYNFIIFKKFVFFGEISNNFLLKMNLFETYMLFLIFILCFFLVLNWFYFLKSNFFNKIFFKGSFWFKNKNLFKGY
jgi:hypothetical protein